jgi:hypothetical protein
MGVMPLVVVLGVVMSRVHIVFHGRGFFFGHGVLVHIVLVHMMFVLIHFLFSPSASFPTTGNLNSKSGMWGASFKASVKSCPGRRHS